MSTRRERQVLVALYKQQSHLFQQFLNVVIDSFRLNPELNARPHSIIHSIKYRLKDPSNLEEKILRKEAEGRIIASDNLFQEITDFAGVRVLHLYQEQFKQIHNFIHSKVVGGDWHLHEAPVAYSWDPDSRAYFERAGLTVELKESHYTSIHYVVRPRADADVSCEIQVRTLFEEVWGEIDHAINYPTRSEVPACREQLRVLAKLVSTGSRLADSIFRLAAPAIDVKAREANRRRR